MAILKTKEDWWTEFTRIKDHIREWGPSDQSVAQIASHPLAERTFGKKLTEFYKTQGGKTFWQVVDELHKNQDRMLYYILNSIWADAPDQPYIHEWRSWGAFCDLCSEGPDCLWTKEEQDAESQED